MLGSPLLSSAPVQLWPITALFRGATKRPGGLAGAHVFCTLGWLRERVPWEPTPHPGTARMDATLGGKLRESPGPVALGSSVSPGCLLGEGQR